MMDSSLCTIESKAVCLDLLRWPGSGQDSIMYSGYTDNPTAANRVRVLREFPDDDGSYTLCPC